MKPRALLLLLLSSAAAAQIDETPQRPPRNLKIPDLKALPAMDGIDPKGADRFWEKWHLVTTRYRKDNDQMRFVFANDLAWQALLKRSPRFPDGAMFGKIVFLPEPDPTFPSSQVPAQYLRIQLMKKDSKGHPDNNSWAYALYGDASTPAETPEKQKATAMACHACHTLVASRDYVFAEPVFEQWTLSATPESTYEGKFEKREAVAMTPLEKRAVQAVAPDYKGPVMRYGMRLFSGSLGESTASVAGFSAKAGLPFVLVDEATQLFLATKPLPAKGECATLTRVVVTAPYDTKQVKEGEVCNGKLTWRGARPLP